MQKLKFTVILLVLAFQAQAQSFLTPYSTFISDKPSYVITQDGDSIFGTIRSVLHSGNFIKRVSIKDNQGKVHKLEAFQIRRFATQPGNYAFFETIAERTSSLRQIIKTDFKDVRDREWLIYDRELLPRRTNKYGLLQLLNPGFDQHIKVYDHPNGSKSMPIKVAGIRVVGGEDRTLLVVKDNQQAVIIRKVSYKQSFADLFSDEPELIKAIDGKPKFEDFAQHIFAYNDLKGVVYYYATKIK
jgi:hypothetical protein